ncbi:MAG TPA: hypothetical protein VH724_00630 [Candidatus Angelobacter sp.]|nr:hypothetical protein [Candidatus Angelobacter sp.]
MTSTTQEARNPGFYAGLYMRTRKKVRFWGWGRPEWKTAGPENRPIAELERPWAALADWLRAAHSLAGTNRGNAVPEAPARMESPAIAPAEEPAAAPTTRQQKRKLRFIWDRHFKGLVYR